MVYQQRHFTQTNQNFVTFNFPQILPRSFENAVFLFSGLSGLTAAVTVDNDNDPCTNGYSLFTNLNYYKDWMNCNMRGPMSTCAVDLPNVRHNLQSRSHVKNTMQNMEICSPTDVDHRNIPNIPIQ